MPKPSTLAVECKFAPSMNSAIFPRRLLKLRSRFLPRIMSGKEPTTYHQEVWFPFPIKTFVGLHFPCKKHSLSLQRMERIFDSTFAGRFWFI
jgi:hypothetical protein